MTFLKGFLIYKSRLKLVTSLPNPRFAPMYFSADQANNHFTLNQRTPGDSFNSIESFFQSVDRDPTFGFPGVQDDNFVAKATKLSVNQTSLDKFIKTGALRLRKIQLPGSLYGWNSAGVAQLLSTGRLTSVPHDWGSGSDAKRLTTLGYQRSALSVALPAQQTLRFAPNSASRKKTKKIFDWVCYSQSQFLAPKCDKVDQTDKENIGAVVDTLSRTVTKMESNNTSLSISASRNSLLRNTQSTIERQNILECYKERNLLRLIIAFFDAPESRSRMSVVTFTARSASDNLLLRALRTEKPHKWLSFLIAGNLLNQIARTSFNFAYFCLGRLTINIKGFRLFWKQIILETSALIGVQILIIPYTFLFGLFYTLNSFQLSRAIGATLTSKVPEARLSPNSSMIISVPFGAVSPQTALRSLARKLGFVREMHAPALATKLANDPTRKLDGSMLDTTACYPSVERLAIYSYSIFGNNVNAFPEELLRLSHFSSKIFILWGFLNIWKGVRPAKSTRNDYVIQTRLLTSRKNKKRFHDIEGIEKFLPVLKTLVESFQFTVWKTVYVTLVPFGAAKSRLLAPPTTPTQKVSGSPSEALSVDRASRNGTHQSQPRSANIHPKGYLFIGPPGTGKTLLAQAVAGEAKVNLICLSASEIQKQIDIGTRIGAIRLRNLFEQARKNTPCILFLDEIDAIGRARNESMDLKLFTEFLIQMDSFSVKTGFLVIGTTNFLSSLDSAFIRSGRFDRIIGLNYPGKQTRIAILKLYTKKQGWDSTISWDFFGEITKGFSAADLAKVVNESSLYLIGTQVVGSAGSVQPHLVRPTTPAAFHLSRANLIHTCSSLQRGIERISHV